MTDYVAKALEKLESSSSEFVAIKCQTYVLLALVEEIKRLRADACPLRNYHAAAPGDIAQLYCRTCGQTKNFVFAARSGSYDRPQWICTFCQKDLL